jgi:hypothetical protein
MMNNKLWNLLETEGLVSGDLPALGEFDSPWYVKVILAFSGWLAAIFILSFLSVIFSHLYQNTLALIFFGVSFIAIAYFLLSKKKDHEFIEHLALAFSVAGQALLTWAIVESSDITLIWFLVAVMHLFLILIMPNYVHRLVSAFIATLCFAAAIYSISYSSTALLMYSALLMLCTGLLWLNEFKYQKSLAAVQAIGYGLVTALVIIKGTNVFININLWGFNRCNPEIEWIQPWMGEVLLGAVALYVVCRLMQKSHVQTFSNLWLLTIAGALLLVFLSINANGLIVGVMIMLLGFSASNRVLIGLAVMSLLFYISSYYYLLEISLLDKSLTLLVLGLVLILGRWFLLKLPPETSKDSARSPQ